MKRNSGQVLLIVIITMIVALTVGLSLASRTITNLKLSKQNEDSQRAFQAASAGIDKYINASTGTNTNILNNNSSIKTTVTTVNGARLHLNNGGPVDQDRGIDVWLSTYPNYAPPLYTGTITMYWGSASQTVCSSGASGTNPDTKPAIEVIILSGSMAAPTVSKYFYDRCIPPRIKGTRTSSSSGGVFDGVVYGSSATIPAITNGLIMKIIPLYNSAIVGLQGSFNFPSQGKVIDSTGTSGDSARKIIYFESYPQIPNEIFSNVVMSQ